MNTLFKNKKANPARLLSFGFSQRHEAYVYSCALLGGQFQLTVTVGAKGQVSTDLIDLPSGEHYVLHHIAGASGAFVGAVREEYDSVLATIASACFEPDVFKSEGARQIIEYVRLKYHTELEFLWQRFPDNAICRRADSGKWYAALLTVQKKKLGLSGEGSLEVVDLRGKPEDVALWVEGKKYLPGYHMNKKHWFTICLDGSVAMDEIFCRIDESFALALK